MLSASRLINTYTLQKETDDPFKLTLDVIETAIVRARKNGDEIVSFTMVFNTRAAAGDCFKFIRSNGYCVVDEYDDYTEMATGMVQVKFTVDWKAAILRQRSAVANEIYNNLYHADFVPDYNYAAGTLAITIHDHMDDLLTAIKRIEPNDYTRVSNLAWLLHEVNDENVSDDLICALDDLLIKMDITNQLTTYEDLLALADSWGGMNGYTLLLLLPQPEVISAVAWIRPYYDSVYDSVSKFKEVWLADALRTALRGLKNEEVDR